MTASPASVTLHSVLRRSDEVLFQDVGGEAVLLDLGSEQYFGLDPVGTRIWELLDGNATLEAVHRTLCEEYDAPPERIRADLLVLAASLLDAGLAQAA